MAIRPDAVIFQCAKANIVDGFEASIAVLAITDQAHMWQVPADAAGQDVTGLPVVVGNFVTMTSEPFFNIRYAAMINVSIGTAQAPDLGVGTEIGCHVFVNRLLEIKREGIAVSADDNIGADAATPRNIAAGIAELNIGWIVQFGHANLRAGLGQEPVGATDLLGEQARRQREGDEAQKGEAAIDLHAIRLAHHYGTILSQTWQLGSGSSVVSPKLV